MATRREQILADYRKAVLHGMAREIWIHAVYVWANANVDDEQAAELLEEVNHEGASWGDAITSTPDASNDAAEALVQLYEAGNGDLVDLYAAAVHADTGKAYEFDVLVGKGQAAPLPSEFGVALADMAMGTGASWFDDHKRFALVRPHFEVKYDGEDLTWNGKEGELENPSRAELRDPTFVRDALEESIGSEFATKVASIKFKPGMERSEAAFKRDLANNLAMAVGLDDEPCGCEVKQNPAGRVTVTWADGKTSSYGNLELATQAVFDKAGGADYVDLGDRDDAPNTTSVSAYNPLEKTWYRLATIRLIPGGRPPGVPNPSSAPLKLDVADYDAVEQLNTAAATGTRFGDRKVFLSSIVDLSDPTTRRVLSAMQRDGMIELARADLVAAMDPELVKASELKVRGATYHFLVTDPPRSNPGRFRRL